MQPEAVLLVDDGETEVGERDALLYKGVRPDQQVERAVGDGVEGAQRDLCP